jgi:alginate O-acetyltransferase complex protein AlgI
LSILLPIGLSFHIFQVLCYTVELYRVKQKAERHFGILYIILYTQLDTGHIDCPQNLLHQFYEKHSFDNIKLTADLKLIALGLFKKVVIEDRLTAVVDNVYNNHFECTGFKFHYSQNILFFSNFL